MIKLVKTACLKQTGLIVHEFGSAGFALSCRKLPMKP